MAEEYERSGEISKFNPAQHKMNRLNELSRIINESKLSLHSYNNEFNDWNYNLYFLAVTSLYEEVFVKFSEEEKISCDVIRVAIEMMKNKYPIQEDSKKRRWTAINVDRFKIFISWIRKYEEKVKELQDEHGLDTPNQEDDQGL